MLKNTMTALLLSAATITAPISAQDVQDKETPAQFKERLQKAFLNSFEKAKANLDDNTVALPHIYDAFRAAFQAGQFTQAEQMLSIAVSKGHTLTAWDNVAMGEIVARRGDFDLAAQYMDVGLTWFKESHCKTDPNWKAFGKKLKEKDSKAIIEALSASTPALVHPYPQKDIYFWRDYIGFNNADPKYPEILPIVVTVNTKGRITCAQMENYEKRYKRMLVVTKGHSFEPATVNGKKVWRYGYPYEIRQEQIFISDVSGRGSDN